MRRALLLLATVGACAGGGGGDASCTSVWYRPGFSLAIDADTAFPDGAYVFTIERDGASAVFPVTVANGWGECTAAGCAHDTYEPGVLIAISGTQAYVEDWNGREDDRPSASKVIVQLERGNFAMGSWRFFPMYQGVEGNGAGCGVTWLAQYAKPVSAPAQ